MVRKKVPTGVAILAVLNGLGGLALLGLGVTAYWAYQNVAFNVGNLAVFSVVLGLLNLVAAYGLWVGKSWAWYLAMLVGAISLIYAVWSLMPIPLVIDGVIVAYLLRKGIQRYFKVHIGWAW